MASPSDISQVLSATLSADPNVRISAELKLAELLVQPQNALSLTQLFLAQDADLSLRQMSIRSPRSAADRILLRKYINERWSPFFPSFRGNAPPAEVKDQIRAAVFQGLSDPLRKVRSLSAHTLSLIAKSDWPDEYPSLLTDLIRLISSDDVSAIHGAMQVFTEFVRDELPEDHLLPVLRELLPVLLSILGASEKHSALTRSRTVAVFRQCVEALYIVKGHHPDSVKEAAESILPVWLNAFKVLLSIDPLQDVSSPNWDGLALRIQVFRTLDTIHTSFSRSLAPFLSDFLSLSLHHLQALYPTFAHYYLLESALSASPPQSSEDEPVELARLAAPVMDFISSAGRSARVKPWFESDNLGALVGAILRWAQMTRDNEEEWAADANVFVAQEDDDTQAYSIRIAAFDLVGSLIANDPAATIIALDGSLNAVIAESTQARNASDTNWWRALEAVLAALGAQSEAILDAIEDEVDSGRPAPIDVGRLLADVVPSLITLSEYPFLQGRGLVVAGKYSKLLPGEIAGQYLDAAVQVLEAAETGVPFKISAVKALQQFCHGIDAAALAPTAPRMVKDLGPFLLETTEDTLSLVLETLSSTVEVDGGKWLTPDLARDVVLALLQVWEKNIKDPILLSILTDLFTSIASASPAVYAVAVEQALPRLAPAVANTDAEQSWIASSAIELVGALVEGASEEQGLGAGFFAAVAPGLFQTLKVTEDRDVIQNGISLLTLVVRKDIRQLLDWKDAEDCTGLGHTLLLISRLVRSQSESGGLVIGDLIIHLLRRAGVEVLPVLPDLLWALLARMQEAETATFLQSLIIPFAFLVHTQRDAVLDLVEKIDPASLGGRSGLDVLLNTWCENAGTFQGFWPIRVSTIALCELVAGGRASVRDVVVKGDIVVTDATRNARGEVIMTRSKTKRSPHEWTRVPFPVKALKILLHELQSNGEAASMAALGDVGDDDGGSDWEDEEEKAHQGFKKDEFAFLSDMLKGRTGGGGPFDEDDLVDDNDDDDLKRDPISQINIQEHIVGFLRQSSQSNVNDFASVVGQLNGEEQEVVRRAVAGQ